MGDTLIALSNLSMMTYSIQEPTQVLDRILLSNPLQPDYVYHTDGSAIAIFDVLANDSPSFEYTITAIKGNPLRGSVRILPDQRLEYTDPADLSKDEWNWWDSFSYEVTTTDGGKFETMVSVFGQRLTGDVGQQGSATIILKAVDDQNNQVTSTSKGDEFWVEVLVQDGRPDGQGVYSAYVDLSFDTKSFEIVGDSEPLGEFTNRLLGEKTEEGWKQRGGFSNSPKPHGCGEQSVVRFKLRATEDAVLSMTATPSTVPGNEMTLYGIDTVIPVENITAGSLQMPIRVARTVENSFDFDVNADGLVTPLDSLIVINRINREEELLTSGASLMANSTNSKLDVNLDGLISLLDVLVLVNRINQNPLTPMMMVQQETTDQTKKKSLFVDAFFCDETMMNELV